MENNTSQNLDPADPGSGEKKRPILVVDDNFDHLEITVWSLISVGFRVIGCTDGAEALTMLHNRHDDFQAVITDLSMPVLDGLTVAEEIRRNEQAFGLEPVPLAFFTAHSEQPGGATERIAERCQVDRIWHKPHDVQRIGDLVKGWLLGLKQRPMAAGAESVN